MDQFFGSIVIRRDSVCQNSLSRALVSAFFLLVLPIMAFSECRIVTAASTGTLKLKVDPPLTEVYAKAGSRSVQGTADETGSFVLEGVPLDVPVEITLKRTGWKEKTLRPVQLTREKPELTLEPVRVEPSIASIDLYTHVPGVEVKVAGKTYNTHGGTTVIIEGLHTGINYEMNLTKDGYEPLFLKFSIPPKSEGQSIPVTASLVRTDPTKETTGGQSPSRAPVRSDKSKLDLGSHKFSEQGNKLISACELGKFDEVQRLLMQGTNINSQDHSSWQSALGAASRSGNIDVVKLLLKKGAEIDVDEREGVTPVIDAAVAGHKQIVMLLLERGATVIAKSGNAQESGLIRATFEGNERKVKQILSEGVNVDTELESGRTVLALASCIGQASLVSMFLERGARVDSRDLHGRTPLLHACKNGKRDVVDMLLNHGADINHKDRWAETALTVASSDGHTAIVKLLLDKGAPKSEGLNLGLFLASSNGHTAIVKLLLDKGADVNARYEEYGGSWGGWTALMVASFKGHAATVKLLLDKGADVNAEHGNETAWSLASLNQEITDLLEARMAQDDQDESDDEDK